MRTVRGGHGVFTQSAIEGRARVLEFVGEQVPRAVVAREAQATGHDGFLQISRDAFLGLSGGADDYVNHSCTPNCFVDFDNGRVWLVALAAIAAGAELYFDYGVTQIDFPFRFYCLCGTSRCRGAIGNYDEIPPETLTVYRAQRVVPGHIEALLD